jgi:hypothetical protein
MCIQCLSRFFPVPSTPFRKYFKLDHENIAYQNHANFFFFSATFFLMGLGFEFRASCLQSRYSTAPVHYAVVIFFFIFIYLFICSTGA